MATSTEQMDRLIQGLDAIRADGFCRCSTASGEIVLMMNGVDADRLQIPMTKILGFRHPTLWGVILTWHRQRGFADTDMVTHDRDRQRLTGRWTHDCATSSQRRAS